MRNSVLASSRRRAGKKKKKKAKTILFKQIYLRWYNSLQKIMVIGASIENFKKKINRENTKFVDMIGNSE